jgi:hypothetical protein
MENRVKRPPSVWIAQILLLIFTLILLIPFLLILVSPVGGPALALLLVFVVFLGLITLFAMAFWGMARRKMYGRWWGVVSLSLMFLLVIFGQVFQQAGPLKRYEYDNPTQLMWGTLTTVVIDGLFLFLIIRLATAKQVTRFFSDDFSIHESRDPLSIV